MKTDCGIAHPWLVALVSLGAGVTNAPAQNQAPAPAGLTVNRTNLGPNTKFIPPNPGRKNAGVSNGKTYGWEVKAPIFGGACPNCPWGSLGLIVADEMKLFGYDVTLCMSCARADAARWVADDRVATPREDAHNPKNGTYFLLADPPAARVDFGATTMSAVRAAYNGTGPYANDGARKNLRIIAMLEVPRYLVAATSKKSGITDLSQLKTAKYVHLVMDDTGYGNSILAYYDVTREMITANGGWISRTFWPRERADADVVIHSGDNTNAPEWNVLQDMGILNEMNFLQLPDALLDKIAKDTNSPRGPIPAYLFRGLTHDIESVWMNEDTVVMTRDDVSDEFAYDVAKAMDVNQSMAKYSSAKYFYNVWRVAKPEGVPLHPGAARYYRERGYLQ